MFCGTEDIIFARMSTDIVAQKYFICYHRHLSGNEALSKERKRHGYFEGAASGRHCGDVCFSAVDGDQFASDSGQAEFGWQTAKLSRAFVRGQCAQSRCVVVILVLGGTELERDRILRQLVG